MKQSCRKSTQKRMQIIFFLMILVLFGCKGKVKKVKEEKESTPKGAIEVKAMVDNSSPSIGDMIIYTLTIEALPEISPRIPEVGSQIKGLRIVDIGSDGPKKINGRNVWKKWYKLQADFTGSYLIPAVKVTYQDAGGKELEASASQIFIEVKSVMKEGEKAGDIVDIKPLEKIKNKLLYLYIGIAAGLLLLAGAGIGIRMWLKKRGKGGEEYMPLPDEVALNDLEKLKSADYLEQEDYRSFYFELSEIFREYIEKRYRLPAQESTTEELIPQIEKLNLTRTQKDMVRVLTRWEDLVKFAQQKPSQEKAEKDWEETRKLVVDTREKPEESFSGHGGAA